MTANIRHSFALLLASATVGSAWISTAEAQASDRQTYNLPAQPLGASLRAIAARSGRNILASAEVVANQTAPALKGDFTADEALQFLLNRSGLRVRKTGTAIIVEADPLPSNAAGPDGDIVVTGSRIRGSISVSPVITITRDDARNAGQGTLGEIARSLPQSFGGGQNPGLGFNVPTASGVDVGGGSSINLRGLGSDATLTLLNGHRLAYSSSRQSVDVSTVPLGALERIEVVADGASAIYGSDAVGGVANIILRRDMTGIETRARLGAATEGGDFSQQYGITAGSRWSTGGFIAAYEFNRATAIDSSDRDYAAMRSIGLRLLPTARSNNALLSAHQLLDSNLELRIDGLFNKRNALFIYPQNLAGDLALSRAEQTTKETAFAIAPSLRWTIGNAAQINLSASYAKDRVEYRTLLITPTSNTPISVGCYCNRAFSVELGGDGRLFELPGGWAKVALGVGYRTTGLRADHGVGNFQTFDRSLSSTYGYAELNLPLLAPDGPTGMRLNLDAAVRYERYRSIGSIATPKVGVVWSPVAGLDFKASWGRSFRAPTLLQRYQPVIATLYPATLLGGTGFPAGSTVLGVQGGSAALRPERASSWSLTADVHPRALDGLDVQLSYFSTRYIDRIVAPITFLTQSLSNQLYAAQVTRNPSTALIQSTLANAGLFQTLGGAVYNPATIVAVVDNSNVNAGSQRAHGLDILASYRIDPSPRDQLSLTANASYLVSNRQISAAQPVIGLAGTLFNPPHWRARGSIGWQRDGFGVTSTLSYVGDLADTRSTPAIRVADQATVDIAMRYRTPASSAGWLRGLDFILAVQNILDTAPPSIATSSVFDTPYDSTNYSPIGRFVSLTIAKKW